MKRNLVVNIEQSFFFPSPHTIDGVKGLGHVVQGC